MCIIKIAYSSEDINLLTKPDYETYLNILKRHLIRIINFQYMEIPHAINNLIDYRCFPW